MYSFAYVFMEIILWLKVHFLSDSKDDDFNACFITSKLFFIELNIAVKYSHRLFVKKNVFTTFCLFDKTVMVIFD